LKDIEKYWRVFEVASEHKKLFVIIILILLLIDLVILLNIPFLRQIIGFLFLTILPGLLVLQILKLNKLDFTEKFVLSVGLSISFLLFFGLLINNLSLSLGYETPLSKIPLLFSFNIAFIVLGVIGYKVNKEPFFSLPNLNLSTSEKAFLVVPVFFPALSIFGMHVMNTTDNNIILMLLLFLIPIYVAFVCFFNQKFPKRLYPVVIFLISLSLILIFSLRSNHIMGSDIFEEYHFFQMTMSKLHWSIEGHNVLDACLSISLLPAIYRSLLNINKEFLFKVLYSLLFSVSPLIIYVISKKYVQEPYAFLASIFFMSQVTFLKTAYNARTNTAILFFALAIMFFFSDEIDPVKKKILFIIFMISTIVSHYSTAYLFFFLILMCGLAIQTLKRKYTFKESITPVIIFLFFALIFFWYGQVTESSFTAGIGFVKQTFTNLGNFFILESRGEAAGILGKAFIGHEEIPYKIHFVLSWVTFFLIGVGVISAIIKRNKMISISMKEKMKKESFLKTKFEIEYFIMMLVCSALLVVMVALPYLGEGYGIQRLYTQVIVILSIIFVIGCMMISRHLKAKSYLMILLILIPYFLCVTGVTYQMFGIHNHVTLNSDGNEYDILYIHDQEVISGRWLCEHGVENLRIYTDKGGGSRLSLGYGVGKLPKYQGSFVQNEMVKGGYIYLRHVNVVEGKVYSLSEEMKDITEYPQQFVNRSEIYDNGGSKVYK